MSGDPISIRDARPGDAAAIASIAREAWPATYAGLLPDDFIAGVLATTYAEDSLHDLVTGAREDPASEILVAERRGEVVGYLHSGPGPSGPELHRLYLRPELTGGGIGRLLLHELNRRLEPGTEYVALVHPGNDGAVRFYEREGFTLAARIDGMRAFLGRSGLEGVAPESVPGCDMLMRYRVPSA